jgi:VWFA-related protein
MNRCYAGAVTLLLAVLPSATAQQQAPTTTFKSKAELVLVPAVVTEGDKPVTGLRAGDFVLLHNGKPEPISVFEEVNGVAGRPQQDTLPPRIAQNFGRAADREDVHILLLDFFGADVWTKESIERQLLPIAQQFTDKQIPLAVVVFSYNGLTQVHSLADDPADFAEAVKLWAGDRPHKLKVGDATPHWGSPFTSTTPERTAEALRQYAFYRPDSPRKGILNNGYEFDALAMRKRAMTQMAEAFRGMPGRKRVIWFGAAPDSVWFPDPNFVLYPILVMHLFYRPEEGTAFKHGNIKLFCEEPVDSFSSSLKYPTRPDLCTDAPALCVQRLLAESGHYYLLGFYLGESAQPGLHALAVKVNDPKAVVRARDSFAVELPSGISVEAIRKARKKAIDALIHRVASPTWWDRAAALKPLVKVNEQQQVLEALGSPLDYTGLPLRLEWSAAGEKGGEHVDLTLTSPPGAIVGTGTPAVVRASVLVYLRTGNGSERFLEGKIEQALSPEQEEHLVKEGFVYRTQIGLPQGKYEMRVLVRDVGTNRIGTVSTQVDLSGEEPAGTLNP